MRVRVNEARKKCELILQKKGISKEESKIIADEYIEGELLGKKSHGLQAFPALVKKLDKLPERWTVEKETDSMVFIDARGYFGEVVGKVAAEMACKKAAKEGIGMVAVKDMLTWLRPRTPARAIAEKGMVGIVVNNGGKEAIAPSGGIDPILGTNPIGIGIPSKGGVISFDMATSKRAWGEVRIAKALGIALPDESFLDKKGEYTRNADEVHSAVPFGDYKGYALAFLIEILTGSLVNMPMGAGKTAGDYRTALRGAIVIAIDPSKLTNLNEFKRRNYEFAGQIKASRRQKDVEEIYIPGEKSELRRKKSIDAGEIDVDKSIWDEIKKL